MRKLFILTVALLLVSCSHHPSGERSVASTECWKSLKGEYQSYFDNVEKCMEKETEK